MRLPCLFSRSLLAGFCWLFPFVSASHAGPISSVQLQEGAEWGSPIVSMSYDSGVLAQTSVPYNSVSVFGAMASGSIGAGEIHGYTQAQGGLGVADATLAGFWNDGITVGGLPNGTLVMIRITDSLDSMVSVVGATSQASAVSQVTIFAGGNKSFLDLSNTNTNIENGIQTTSMELACVASSLSCFQFTEELALRTSAFPSGIATADASNTNQVFIDVLTPGATITSASGVGYSSTVPEPATAGPVLAVFAGLLVVVRRNQGVRLARRISQ